MIKWFIEMNFPTLMILLYMSVFLLINSIFSKTTNRVFATVRNSGLPALISQRILEFYSPQSDTLYVR